MSSPVYTLKIMSPDQVDAVHSFFKVNKIAAAAKDRAKRSGRSSGFAEIPDKDFSKALLLKCNKTVAKPDEEQLFCFVATNHTGKVVGAIIFEVDKDIGMEVFIKCLGRDPTCKKQGVGKNLLRLTTDFVSARSDDLECVTLESSFEAVPFYETMGFRAKSGPGNLMSRAARSGGIGPYVEDASDARFIDSPELSRLLANKGAKKPAIQLSEVDVAVRELMHDLNHLTDACKLRGILCESVFPDRLFSPPYTASDIPLIERDIAVHGEALAASKEAGNFSIDEVKSFVTIFLAKEDMQPDQLTRFFSAFDNLQLAPLQELFNPIVTQMNTLVLPEGVISEGMRSDIKDMFLDELGDLLVTSDVLPEDQLSEQCGQIIDGIRACAPELPTVEEVRRDGHGRDETAARFH